MPDISDCIRTATPPHLQLIELANVVNLTWERSVQTRCPRETVYAYLADFDRQPEWATSLDRMEKIDAGDANGFGRRYMTYEELDFADGSWRRHLPGTSSVRATCEVRELVPGKRIAGHARPAPGFLGRADLQFEFEDVEGGTLVTQRVVEHYRRPIAFVMKSVMNVTEDGIRNQLERTLDGLCDVLDRQQVGPGRPPEAVDIQASGTILSDVASNARPFGPGYTK